MQSLLIVDQEILCEIDIEHSPFAIVSVFNICYTRSIIYFFTFLETVLLNLIRKLSPTVANFLSVINRFDAVSAYMRKMNHYGLSDFLKISHIR